MDNFPISVVQTIQPLHRLFPLPPAHTKEDEEVKDKQILAGPITTTVDLHRNNSQYLAHVDKFIDQWVICPNF